jgi:hypothetical protein
MTLIWQTTSQDPCERCQALNGDAEGTTWSTELGPELDLWKINPHTQKAERQDTHGMIGTPPLHPNCQCEIVSSDAQTKEDHPHPLTHCWTDKAEWAEEKFGEYSPQHVEALDHPQTCMLQAQHRGPHQWTDDDTIQIRFRENLP